MKPEGTLKKGSTGRKPIKSKIQVAVSEPVTAEALSKDDDGDVPEIEYCPPRPVDLPDPPEEVPFDDSYPYLRGRNQCGGYGIFYDIPRDKHGVPLRERKEEEEWARVLQEQEAELGRQVAELVPPMLPNTTAPKDEKSAKPHPLGEVDTIKAKRAANALSCQIATRVPSAAMKPTASSMQKQRSSKPFLGRKKQDGQPTNPNPMQHAAAVMTSKQTIGYSKGRAVSSVLPNRATPQGQCHNLSSTSRENSPHNVVWDQIKKDLIGEDDDIDIVHKADSGFSRDSPTKVDEEEEEEEADQEIVELPMLEKRSPEDF